MRITSLITVLFALFSCSPKNQDSIKEKYFTTVDSIPYFWKKVETNITDYSAIPVDERPADGGPKSSGYPVFYTDDKTLEVSIAKLNMTIKEYDYEVINPVDTSVSETLFEYEVVVANPKFVSIMFVFMRCGNRCHEFIRSVNFDIASGKRLSNHDFIAALGLSPDKFKNSINTNLDKFAVYSYFGLEQGYPSFEKVLAGDEQDSEEIPEETRLTTNFENLLENASVIPVIYKDSLKLRIAVEIPDFNVNKIGFKDFNYTEFKK